MRVTNNMLINNMLYNLNRNLETMSKEQDMLASGKKVMRPSDDPVATSKILKYKTDLQELEQYDRNTEDALAWLNITETAIEDMGNILQRLRELAVQGANETLTTDDRQKLAEEVGQLKEQMINTGNSTFAGRYIFSGYQTDEPLFNDDGTFNIDITDHDINTKPLTIYEIGIGETLEVSTNGLDVFGYIELDNFFTNNIPTGNDVGVEATKSFIKGTFDLNTDYTAGSITINIDGTDYTTQTGLNGSGVPVDKADLIDTLKASEDLGGNRLDDVADIYFDNNDKLIVKPRDYGALAVTATGLYLPISTDGTVTSEATISGDFDFKGVYPAPGTSVTLGGVTYDVQTAMDGSVTDITQNEIIANLENADDGGGNLLGTVANIYFDDNNQLRIESLTPGVDTITTANLYSYTTETGVDTGAATLSTGNVLTDADIAAATEEQEIFITVNGEEQVLTVDMSAYNTVADYVTGVQAELDAVFLPSGSVTVTDIGGGVLEYSATLPTNEGEAPEISMYVKKTSDSELISDITEFYDALVNGDSAEIQEFLGDVDVHIENLLGQRADIGARSNRMELVLNRIGENAINFTELLSNAEDADMSEVIMKLKNSENVYKASLSAGARVIQPTLMDFLG